MVSSLKSSERLHCPVCDDVHLKDWGSKSGYQLYKCCDCTHFFADVRTNPETLSNSEEFRRHITNELMASDDAYYRHLCQGEIKGAHTFVTANLILRQVKSPGWQPKDWLDVGSGSGFLVAELKKIGIDSVGVEPGGWGQISARDKGISIVNGLLTEGTFNKRFDAVSATDVIEHQPDPKPMIRLMKRYMNDNGKMFLS